MAGFNLIKKAPTLITLLVLEFVLLLIVSYQIQVNRRVSVLEHTGLMILGPVQELNDTIVGSVSQAFKNKKTRTELEAENQLLRQSLEGLDQLRTQLEESELENQRYRELLELPTEDGWLYVRAEVIGRVHRRNDYMITINRGSRASIKPDMGVFSASGVVGVVWEVSSGYAKVMTVNNPSSVVAALVQDSRYAEGYVSGQDMLTGRLENFPNFEQISYGQLIITSGLDGIFPKGLHIGRVLSSKPAYKFQEVELKFNADFSRLEDVIVLIPHCEDEEVAP